MTYMNDAQISATANQVHTDTEISTVEKLKSLTKEGIERSKRILSILRQAFSETREEFQAGRTVISPLAQEVTTEAVSTFKEKGQQAAEAVNKAWKDEASTSDVADQIVDFLGAMTQTAKEKLLPTVEKQAKQQAGKLDELLSDRYSDQYTDLKNRFKTVRSWITANNTVINEPATTPTDSVDSTTEPSIVIEVDSVEVDRKPSQ